MRELNYQDFKEVLVESLPSFLPETLKDCHVHIERVEKINGSEDVIIITNGRSKVSPNTDVAQIYQSYLSNNLNDVLKSLAEQFSDVFKNHSEVIKMADCVCNPEWARTHVMMRLVNTSRNEKLLQEIPHREFLDLSIIYYFQGNIGNDLEGHMTVTCSLAKQLELTEAELYQHAYANTRLLHPIFVGSLLKKMPSLYDDMDIPDLVFIINCEDDVSYGAVNILYPDILEKAMAGIYGSEKGLFLIPSSTHEFLAIPAIEFDPYSVKLMVHDVNRNIVTPKEYLSDNVYFYDPIKKQISIAK